MTFHNMITPRYNRVPAPPTLNLMFDDYVNITEGTFYYYPGNWGDVPGNWWDVCSGVCVIAGIEGSAWSQCSKYLLCNACPGDKLECFKEESRPFET